MRGACCRYISSNTVRSAGATAWLTVDWLDGKGIGGRCLAGVTSGRYGKTLTRSSPLEPDPAEVADPGAGHDDPFGDQERPLERLAAAAAADAAAGRDHAVARYVTAGRR